MSEYIERDAAVLQLLEKGQLSRRYKLGDIWELNFDEIREAIASIPAADVRPVVRGQWIKHNATHVQKGGMYLECSCCHEYITVLGHVFAYCPNCGARMEES